MMEYKFNIIQKVNVPNKNGVIFTDKALESISNQVSEANKNNHPFPLIISDEKLFESINDITSVNPEYVIGNVKEFSTNDILVSINDNKKDIFNKLLQENYEPGYRVLCNINDNIVSNIKVICFDMIAKDMKA